MIRDSRREQLDRLRPEPVDVLILGGGINGAGILRDLALRAQAAGSDLRTGLIEQNHFASGTSGKNSQLIHGGLRYLKYGQIGLVREALRERSTLQRIAPHLVKPLPFLLPLRHWPERLMYGFGLSLYDSLAGNTRHRWLNREALRAAEPALEAGQFSGAAIFSDCTVHSARMVLENILDAAGRGAIAVNYVRGESFTRRGSLWEVGAVDRLSGEPFTIRTRKLVDATGPWTRTGPVRLVRGSHIVIPRVQKGEHALAWFDDAGRIVFFIPWGSQGQLTLVGTTDVDHQQGPDSVVISAAERDYLRGAVRRLFPAGPVEVISAYSSLRPLAAARAGSATAASREHSIANTEDGILRVSGGKYTTYRAMSEEAANMICAELAPALASMRLTAHTVLPPREEPSLAQAVKQEFARRLGDYLFVSTYLGYERRWDEKALAPLADEMGDLLGWDSERRAAEIHHALRQASGEPDRRE